MKIILVGTTLWGGHNLQSLPSLKVRYLPTNYETTSRLQSPGPNTFRRLWIIGCTEMQPGLFLTHTNEHLWEGKPQTSITHNIEWRLNPKIENDFEEKKCSFLQNRFFFHFLKKEMDPLTLSHMIWPWPNLIFSNLKNLQSYLWIPRYNKFMASIFRKKSNCDKTKYGETSFCSVFVNSWE